MPLFFKQEEICIYDPVWYAISFNLLHLQTFHLHQNNLSIVLQQRQSSKFIKLLLLSLLPFVAIAIPATAPAGSCAAVGIITARASTEAAGEGIIGSLAAGIQSGSTQTVSRTLVDYPALLYPYAQSVQSGFAAITAK